MIMDNFTIANEMLDAIHFDTDQQNIEIETYQKICRNGCHFIVEVDKYRTLFDKLCENNIHILKLYSRKTFYSELERFLFLQKTSSENITQNSVEDFFKHLSGNKPQSLVVYSPVSGICLENRRPLSIGPFVIEYHCPEEHFAGGERCLHIGVEIKDVVDKEKAKEQAVTKFNDFSRIVHFLIGRFDNNHIIKFGLPILQELPGRVYVNSDVFSFTSNGQIVASQHSCNYYDTLPIDNIYFTEKKLSQNIWELEKAKHYGTSMTKMQERILSAIKHIGESAKSEDLRNAILYSCIAVESLFSYDERSLFQASIGDKISEAMAFMVGTDLNSRLVIVKLVKNTYGIRSAISHGGNTDLTDDYIGLNDLTRRCIIKMLTDEAYKEITTIEKFYEHIKILKFT